MLGKYGLRQMERKLRWRAEGSRASWSQESGQTLEAQFSWLCSASIPGICANPEIHTLNFQDPRNVGLRGQFCWSQCHSKDA
ncbi:rCG48503 [Rattus norvegicus]|uniref:RCG48503 n=1 Tax=Rattus norvegicus TaxID=10116 RepID=A6I058_RAT|nr:rCG48503 [Rattus norvegicus]